MQKKRSFYILLGVTALMVVAAVVSQRPDKEHSASHGLHAPGLGERADAVRTIVIRSAEGELRLARTEDGWVARNKDDYPADAGRVRELVFGLSHLERLEKKTSDPERLDRLELTSVDEPGSRAVEVSMLADDDSELASILVGKTEDFQSSGYSRYFVRDAGDMQSWLVRGSLPPVLESSANWLEQELMPDVGAAGFRAIEVTHPDGEAVTVRRESADQQDFDLVNLAGGETVDSQQSVNQIANALERLSLKDVKKAGEAGDEEPAATVEALTFNGVRITARFERREPDYGVTLSAAYEPQEDRTAGEAVEQSQGGSDAGASTGDDAGDEGESDAGDPSGNGADSQAAGADGTGESGEAVDSANSGDEAGSDEAEGVTGEQLAAKLNERWQGRLFIVSQYTVDDLTVRRSDLVKTAEESGDD